MSSASEGNEPKPVYLRQDTSLGDNRFQSYCDAAAAFVLHREKFIEFLENLRMNKQNGKLNHMESNLWKTLHCNATMAEFIILVYYAEAILYPYMKAIRTAVKKKTNMLDLGPLHQQVYDHIQKIIENPDILLGENVSYSTATLHGNKWENPEVIQKAQERGLTIPHIQDLLVAFFKGAAETWKRFTSEFTPGGLIDEANTIERALAWMPASNDENEGALGLFRSLMYTQPQLTLTGHNALTMYFRNNTQAFMAAKFTEPEDYVYLRTLARKAHHNEKKRRQAWAEHRDKVQAEKTAKKEKRDQKARETAERLANATLIVDRNQIKNLKGSELKDQMKLFKQRQAPCMLKGRAPTKVGEMKQLLMDALNELEDGCWTLFSDEESENDELESSEPEDEESDNPEEWEEEDEVDMD